MEAAKKTNSLALFINRNSEDDISVFFIRNSNEEDGNVSFIVSY